MKLNYYAYHLYDLQTEEALRFDLEPFLRQFCANESIEFKNSFIVNGENVYLFRMMSGMFTYLMTRSSELIKKINTHDLTVNEIYDMLQQDEQLGFASYVYFDSHREQCFFGQASTFMAPRTKSLLVFLNAILSRIGLNRYVIRAEAMMHQAVKEDALTLPFMGKATIQFDRENPFFESVWGTFIGEDISCNDVESFEIEIRPRKGQDIQDAVKSVIRGMPDEGLRKFIVRARNDLEDNLTDLYLAGKGSVFDSLENGTDQEISEEMQRKIRANSLLMEKIEDFAEGMSYENDGETPEDILRFSQPGAWANSLGGI